MDRQQSSFQVEVLDGGKAEVWITWAAASTQGRRPEMEDAHVACVSLEETLQHDLTAPANTRTAMFGLFDGHGGKEPTHVVKTQAFYHDDLCSSLFDAFVTMDEEILKDPCVQKELRMLADNAPPGDIDNMACDPKRTSSVQPPKAGSTAVVALVRRGELVLGHIGDSRALVVSKSGEIQVMTKDHKPLEPGEKERIYAAGGFVSAKQPGRIPRVGGTLALSRAFGDSKYKGNEDLSPEEQIVTSAPDTTRLPMTGDTHFMVLACDGVWDVLEPNEVASTCREMLRSHTPLGQIALKIVEHTLDHAHGSGPSQDNITFLLAVFGEETQET